LVSRERREEAGGESPPGAIFCLLLVIGFDRVGQDWSAGVLE
jgi:hypothetical protein